MSEPEVAVPSTVGLGGKAARGAVYTGVGQLTRILIQVGSVVILARLLSPHDYGLFAMVATLTGVADIFRDFGLSSAAVQAPVLTRPQRDNLFWWNAGVGLLLTCTVFLSAPLLAAIFRQPELVGLTHMVSVIFLLNGLATQPRASLSRDLRFRALALIDIISSAIGLAIGVVAALSGLGYWSLACQQIALSATLLVMIVTAAGWLPGRPRRDAPIGGFLRFGVNMVATQLIGYAGNNVDNFTIGVRFGSVPVGLYSRAFQLLMNPLNQLRTPITAVAVPVLSRIQNENERYADFIYRGQVALGYTLVAGLGIVMSASGPITSIFFGSKWLSIAPLLSLLAVAGVFQTLAYVGYWVYVSRGLTGRLFRYTLITVAIKIVFVVVGSQWGVIGVATGYAIAPIVAWPISLWWLSGSTTIPVRRLVMGVLRITAVTAASVVTGHVALLVAAPAGSVAELAANIVASACTYGVLGLAVPAVRRDIMQLIDTVRLLRKRTGAAVATA